MNAREFLSQHTEKVVITEQFPEEGDARFTVQISLMSGGDLERLRKSASDKRVNKVTHKIEEEVNPQKLRDAVATHLLQGWDGLTWGKLLRLTNARLNNGFPEERLREAVPFTDKENVLCVMEEARGMAANAEGILVPMRFEDWVWQKANDVARVKDQSEADAKNA